MKFSVLFAVFVLLQAAVWSVPVMEWSFRPVLQPLWIKPVLPLDGQGVCFEGQMHWRQGPGRHILQDWMRRLVAMMWIHHQVAPLRSAAHFSPRTNTGNMLM